MNGFLLNGLLGGVTGYITNNFAIKMLFKEYLGFGGVIEKEYKSFIENISKLIEKDLINDETLKDELNNEKFKTALKEIIKDILLIQLPKINGNLSINEIEGFEKSKEQFFKFVDDEKDGLSQEMVSIYKEKKINSFISESQFNQITKNLSVEVDKNKTAINDLVYDFLSSKKIEELLSNSAISKIENNLKNEIKNVDFSQFDGDFNRFYEQFLESINIDEIITKTEKNIENMYLRDFINDDKELSYELINRVLKILKSKEGEELLENLIAGLITSLKEIKVSVFEILSDDVGDKIRWFIEDKLPDIIDNLVRFIERNRREIESRINYAVDEVLDSSWSGKILKFIKNVIYDDYSRDKNIVGKIVEAIENYGDRAGVEISNKILEALEEYSIGEIITILEENNLLKPHKLAKIVQYNLQELKATKIEVIDDMLDKQIKDIMSVDLGFLKDSILPKLFNSIKEKYLYQERFKNDLNKLLKSNIEELKSKKIGEFVDEVSINIDVSKFMGYSLLDVKISDIFEVKKIDIEYKEFLETYEKTKFNEIYSKFQNEERYDDIKDIIISLINSNLQTVFKGNVSSVVAKELYKFEPSQIRDMVENFMGKELQPINYLGAGLGAIAGVGYYGFTLAINNPALTYATPLVYGVTGVFTNHLAIEMLFKPYEKKWYLPFFSPGVVARKKPEFAKNIANFVKDDILTDESLNSVFKNHKDNLKLFVVNYLSKNNYEILDNYLKLHNDEISNYIFDALLNFIEDNSNKIADLMVDKIDEFEFDEYTSSFAKTISNKIYELDFSSYLVSYLDSKNLNDFTPYILKIVDNNFDILIDKVVENLEFNNIKKMILQYENEYKEFIENNNLNYFINKKTKEKIVNNFTQKVFELVQDDALIDSVIEKFDKGFNPNERLKDAFGGGLSYALDRNIDGLISSAIRYVKSLKSRVKDEAIDNLPWGTGWALKGKVSDIVDKIFEDTIPHFLYEKEYEIKNIIEKLLEYKVSNLGIDASSINQQKVKEFLGQVFESGEFQKSVEELSKILVENLLELKIEQVLKILNIRNFRQLIDIASPILEDGLDLIQTNLEKSQNELKPISNNLLEVVLEDVSKNKKLSILFQGVNLEKELKTIVSLFKENEKELVYVIEDILSGLFSKEFYSKELLKNDLNDFILISIKEDKEVLKEKLVLFLKEILVNLNSILDDELKLYVLNVLSEAIFNALENNLENIIKSIDMKEVIIREINNMHPKEIEEMFNSFAKSYFSKLKLYGAFGAVFGVPMMFV